MYYLQSVTAGCVGNSPIFWRIGGSGGDFTVNLDEAEQFTEKQADDIIRSTRRYHRWAKWPVGVVSKLAYRTVNIDELLRVRDDGKTSRETDDGLDALPDGLIQYGVMLVNGDGSESGHSLRWRKRSDAARFGESEVGSGRARGFRIFREPAV